MKLIAKITSLLALLAAGTTTSAATVEFLHVEAELDRPLIPANQEQDVVVQIKIRPEDIPHETQRPPVNLSLVLDRSGSMSGEKIHQAIQSAQAAIERLSPDDAVSVIIYNDKVETLAEAQRASRNNVAHIRRALERVRPGGNTAIYAGLNQAAAELRRFADQGYINRMILLSDGLANEGPSHVNDFRALGRAFAGEDIVVSTVGLGLGFNEDIMTTLAQAGQGNMYFVEDTRDLPHIFAAELGDALNVAATDVEIIVRTRGDARIIKSLGREADIGDGVARYRLSQVYGGYDKLALLEVRAPAGVDGDAQDLVDIEVNYVPAGSDKTRQQAISVPIAYTASEVKVNEAASIEVAQNVVDNRVAEAKQEAIVFADQGKRQEAADRIRFLNRDLNRNYSMFANEVFMQENAKVLNEEAGEIEAVGVSNAKRKSYRSDSYQTVNQQTTKQSE